MQIKKSIFGQTNKGESVFKFTLSNDEGMEVDIINYGGIITALRVPDRHGGIGDVVLGFDQLEQYEKEHPYFGCIIGRYANRIKSGFILNRERVNLYHNETNNQLHGGHKGFGKKIWSPEINHSDNEVKLILKYLSNDGEEGYPGNLNCNVEFILKEKNELYFNYHCTTDKTTVVNLTHHDYFNLKDGGKTSALGHELTIYADFFTPTDLSYLPTGEMKTLNKGSCNK